MKIHFRFIVASCVLAISLSAAAAQTTVPNESNVSVYRVDIPTEMKTNMCIYKNELHTIGSHIEVADSILLECKYQAHNSNVRPKGPYWEKL